MQAFKRQLFGAEGSVDRSDDLGQEVALAKSMWLVRLRWLALLAQGVCGILGLRYGLLAPDDLSTYAGVVAGVVLFNVTTQLTLRWYPAVALPWFVFLQMAVDLLVLSALLAMTGGCLNPLFVLIYLHAALGPLVLTVRWSRAYLGLTLACLTVICAASDPAQHVMHGPTLPRELRLAAELLVVGVIWYLTHWFSLSVGQLRQQMSRLQRHRQRGDHLRALGAMAASFSHEFSTPLNTAKIRLERLGRRHAQMAEDPDFQASQSALGQCEAVIRDLFEGGHEAAALRFEDLDLVAFVRNVCERWRSGCSDVRLVVTAAVDSIPCKVPQVVLAKTLVDLLDNAAESGDGPTSDIEVSVHLSPQGATVSIADRGLGVAPTIEHRLGDPFVSTKSDGAGLGLFSANALMEALGGVLKVEPRERGGTIVTLSFPAQPDGVT